MAKRRLNGFQRALRSVLRFIVKTVRRFKALPLRGKIVLTSMTAAVILVVVLCIAIPAGKKRKDKQSAQAGVKTVNATLESGEHYYDPDDGFVPSENGDGEAYQGPVSTDETPDPALPTPEPTPSIRFERGDKGEQVKDIQERLMELGYLGADEPTELYGPATQTAVRLFQRQHQLQTDGILGNITYDLLFSKEAKKYVMFEGAEGEDIEAFQEMLYDLGYLNRKQITGYYGTDTVTAVSAFQKRNKLTVDGKAGENTIERINSEKARPSAEKEAEIKAEEKKAAEEARKKTVEYRVDQFIAVAEKQIGKPYVLGASGPKRFDCSGLVYYCLRNSGNYTTRMNAAGYSKNSRWQKVESRSDLKRGDLIFFRSDSSKSVSHVGIYIGGCAMIDASTSNGKVVKRSCTGSWSRRNFVCGRRPIS